MGNYDTTTKEVIMFHLPKDKCEVDTIYCKHKRPGLTTFPDAKIVENTAHSQVFLRLEVFGNVVTHCLEYLL